jgi:hypothetical protein
MAVVWAEGVDAFYGDAAEGEVFGEFVIIDRDIGDVGAQPWRDYVHDGRLLV